MFARTFADHPQKFKFVVKILYDGPSFQTICPFLMTMSQLNYLNNVIITSIQQLKRWKKGTHLDNIYKELIKTSDSVPVPIQYLSNRLLTLVQEGKVNSKLYRNTVTYIVNPEF